MIRKIMALILICCTKLYKIFVCHKMEWNLSFFLTYFSNRTSSATCCTRMDRDKLSSKQYPGSIITWKWKQKWYIRSYQFTVVCTVCVLVLKCINRALYAKLKAVALYVLSFPHSYFIIITDPHDCSVSPCTLLLTLIYMTRSSLPLP